MHGTRRWILVPPQGFLVASILVGCNAVLGLDQFSVDSAEQNTADSATPACTTNAECTDQATREAADAGTDGGAVTVPAICQKPEGRCIKLVSEDCDLVTGNYLDDNAVLIGSLFQMSNTTVSQNRPRLRSALLAVEQINETFGGVPSSTPGVLRPLVMVSCDAAANLDRAATHLTGDLRVPAIVGPNTSQDTIDVSNRVTVKAGTVVITPSAVAASIAKLIDNDLSWLMMPNDMQRGPLMVQQINELEAAFKTRGKSPVKLGVVYRNDAMGQGTVDSLNELTINGALIGDASNLNINVRINSYAGSQTDFAEIIDSQAAFGPDIVVLAGTSEAITGVMVPLEQSTKWPTADRPYYLGIDPFRGPALLTAVTNNDSLRRRWRGTGLAPGPQNGSFSMAYAARWDQEQPTGSGTGPAYDAVYAIAYALAATKDLPVTGASVVQGLRRLAGGTTKVGTGTKDLTTAFQVLAAGEKTDTVGTFAPLSWDANGAVTGGTIEIWCIGLLSDGKPAYKSSGLTWDLTQPKPLGEYTQCE